LRQTEIATIVSILPAGRISRRRQARTREEQMGKKILSVGNCSFDHGQLSRLMSQHFRADVFPARHTEEALERLRREQFDLVLVNRIFHGNGQQGLDAIRRLKAEPDLAATPIMLVSNFPEHQVEAQAAGAEPGFGKNQFHGLESVESLRRFLE
jgi:CheY-like chemotaxis protein